LLTFPWPAPSASIDRDRTASDPAQLAAGAPGGGAVLLILKAFSDQVDLLTAETGSPLRSQRGAQQDSPHAAQVLERCGALTRCPDRTPASLSSPLEFVCSVSSCFSKVGLLR